MGSVPRDGEVPDDQPRTSYGDFQAIGPAAGVSLGPEFGDHRVVRNLFGLSRSHLYALLAEGKIRSACIRRQGAARGRRIFDLASVRRFVEANVEAKGMITEAKRGCQSPARIAALANRQRTMPRKLSAEMLTDAQLEELVALGLTDSELFKPSRN